MFASTTAAKIFVFCRISWFEWWQNKKCLFSNSSEQHQKQALLPSFFNRKIFSKQTVHNTRKLQVQYLTLVSNDSRSSLRRLRYSLFIRASLVNPLFPCSCPIGILGNLSINSKWRPAHPHPDLLAKYGARWHLWKSKVAKIALVDARIHLQKGQRDNFTRGLKSFATQTFGIPFIMKSPLTSGFFQKIASTHHANLMMLAWGLLKWKMARKKHL